MCIDFTIYENILLLIVHMYIYWSSLSSNNIIEYCEKERYVLMYVAFLIYKNWFEKYWKTNPF